MSSKNKIITNQIKKLLKENDVNNVASLQRVLKNMLKSRAENSLRG